MRWWGWGEDGHSVPLPPAAEGLLRDELGADPGVRKPPVALDQVALPDPGLPGAARERLATAVGADNVRDDRATRIAHAVGRSYPDLVRIRSGDASSAPDAVVLPESAEQVAAVLAACAEHRVAVVPFGGGTERGRRRGAGPRRLRRGDLARPGAPVGDGRGGPDVAHGAARLRPVRTRGGAAAARAGRDARPLPAVVRVLDRGRLGGHALGGPGVDRLWAHRRARRGAALRHAGGRARHEARAGLGGRSQRARAGGGLRGRPGRDLRGDRLRAPGTDGAPLRGLVVRELRRGLRRLPGDGAGRSRGRRQPALRRGRDAPDHGDRLLGQHGGEARPPLSPHARPRGRMHRDPRLRGRGGRGRGPAPPHRRAPAGRGRGGARPPARRGVAAQPLRRPVPARRADGPRRARRDARDGHELGELRHAPRGGPRGARRRRSRAAARRRS